MAKYFYYDREGRRIEADRWKELQEDEDYRTVRRFDNEEMYAALMWNGRITLSQQASFNECRPVYGLIVKNYREDGSKVPDPVFDGKTFFNEATAIEGYEAMLVRITEAVRKEDGTLDEVGNVFIPPPPPDPDLPSDAFIEGLTDDFGAW